MNFIKIEIGKTYILNNNNVVTIMEYEANYEANMPYRSDGRYGNDNLGCDQYIYFNVRGTPNFSSSIGEYSIKREVTTKTDPEYFL